MFLASLFVCLAVPRLKKTYLPNRVQLEVFRSNRAVALATGVTSQTNIAFNKRTVESIDIPTVTLALVAEIMDSAQPTAADGQELELAGCF